MLLAVLYSLRLQIKEMSYTRQELERSAQALEQSKNIAEEQLTQIRKEERKNDLSRVINDYYSDLQDYMAQPINLRSVFLDSTHTRQELLSPFKYRSKLYDITNSIKEKNKNLHAAKIEKLIKTNTSFFNMLLGLEYLAKQIAGMHMILVEYENTSSDSIVSYFYKKKLRQVVELLYEKK
jgi:hypothetical protein